MCIISAACCALASIARFGMWVASGCQRCPRSGGQGICSCVVGVSQVTRGQAWLFPRNSPMTVCSVVSGGDGDGGGQEFSYYSLLGEEMAELSARCHGGFVRSPPSSEYQVQGRRKVRTVAYLVDHL